MLKKRYGRAIWSVMLAAVFLFAATGAKSDHIRPQGGRSGSTAREVSGEDYVVEWKDPAVEEMIRRGLGRSGGDILRSDLDHIEEIYIAGSSHIIINDGGSLPGSNWGKDSYSVNGQTYSDHGKITSMEDFVHFKNLTMLKVLFNSLTDISSVAALSELEHLEELNMGINFITDVSPLSGMTQITTLSIWGNEIEDVSPLQYLTGLEYLYISENRIKDPTPFLSLTNLKELNMWRNQISDEDMERMQERMPYCDFRS